MTEMEQVRKFVQTSGLFCTAAGVMGDMITARSTAPSAELYLAMALTVQKLYEKHTCVQLDQLGGTKLQSQDGSTVLTLPDYAVWRQELRRKEFNRLIAVLDEDCACLPETLLVLDKHGGCYLQRQWNFEQSIVSALCSRGAVLCDLPVLAEGFLSDLVSFFPDRAEHPAPDYQQLALLAALRHKLLVLSGGPGTGKTTVAAAVLAVKLMQNSNLRMILAAPTAKAAMRLQESLQGNLPHLNISDEIKERIRSVECSTIHRALGYRQGSHEFKHNAAYPLACDLLLIDESSMVAQDLMARVLEALPPEADLILLGDRYQLASVEAGSVLADICDGAAVNRMDQLAADEFKRLTGWQAEGFDRFERDLPPLSGCIVELQENHRFARSSRLLGTAAALIRNMQKHESADVARQLCQMQGEEYCFLPMKKDIIKTVLQKSLQEKRLDSGETMLDLPRLAAAGDAESRSKAYKLLNTFKILAPGYDGVCGIRNLNKLMLEIMKLHSFESAGVPLLIRRNNYQIKLFNGDIGLIGINADGEKRVFFADPDGGEREFKLADLPEYEPVFAMSVHKSQGSGFREVLFVMPEKVTTLMTREMIYTAMTRAEKKLVCIGSVEVLGGALAQGVCRMSNLKFRLSGA